MPRKSTSTLRTGDKRREEYIIAMKGEDRPSWSESKLKEMFEDTTVYDELAKLDACVRKVAKELNIPRWRRLHLLRIVRRAWSKVRADEAPVEYNRSVMELVRKYMLDVGTVNRVLTACGLPPVAG